MQSKLDILFYFLPAVLFGIASDFLEGNKSRQVWMNPKENVWQYYVVSVYVSKLLKRKELQTF
jgi:hypothetical protein